jgi:dihydrofolate reductase
MASSRKIIVNIATSADGFIARKDGDLDWLTNRPPPKGFYGFSKFITSIDAKVLGRKTFDVSVRLGAKFDTNTPHYVFSRQMPPKSLPSGVEFVSDEVGKFARRLRAGDGKNVWLMGGGEIIASFLDAQAIDEFIISVVPTFIGDGVPLIAPRHRDVPLRLKLVTPFPDGVVQLHYVVQKASASATAQPRSRLKSAAAANST